MPKSPSTLARALAALVYLAVVPFVALFLWLILAIPFVFDLVALGVPNEQSKRLLPALLLVVLVLTGVWAVRDFRWRVTRGKTDPPFSALRTRRIWTQSGWSKPPKKASRPGPAHGLWDRQIDP